MWRTVFRGVELAAEGLDGPASALDLGTGSGILAILMARRGVYTVASDISWEALRWAARNVSLNSVDGYVDLVQAEGYEAFRCGFDYVLMNPPYLPGDPSSPIDAQFLGGGPGEA